MAADQHISNSSNSTDGLLGTSSTNNESAGVDVVGGQPARPPCVHFEMVAPPPSLSPARSPPGGLDALSNEERVQLAAAVAERFQAEAQIIGAVESSRAQRNAVLGRGRYAPITRTDLTFANGSLLYTVHGPCELAHRMLVRNPHLDDELGRLGLRKTTEPACDVLEFGGPRPPPHPPPLPAAPSPCPPPANPPGSIDVSTSIRLTVTTPASIAPRNIVAFARTVQGWVEQRQASFRTESTLADKIDGGDALAVVTDATDSIVMTASLSNASVAELLPQCEDAARTGVCAGLEDCSVTISASDPLTPPNAPPSPQLDDSLASSPTAPPLGSPQVPEAPFVTNESRVSGRRLLSQPPATPAPFLQGDTLPPPTPTAPLPLAVARTPTPPFPPTPLNCASDALPCAGSCLRLVSPGACPDFLDAFGLPQCDQGEVNSLCEGDGECGTADNADNCPGKWDVYFISPPLDAPLPPPNSPPPSPPPVYNRWVQLQSIRSRGLQQVLADGDDATTPGSEWITALRRSPLAATHLFVTQGETLTGLTANVTMSFVAPSKHSAHEVAVDSFVLLLDGVPDFLSALSSNALGVDVNAEVTQLRAQYLHPDNGLVVLEGSLPPPPPRPPPSAPADAQAVVAITAAVTTAVAVSVAAAVGGAVASSVAGATAGSAAGGAGGGAGGGAAGAGGGAAAGVAPLIFGVQRFSTSNGLATEKSELQDGTTTSMSWAKGSFGNPVSSPSPPPTSRARRRLFEGGGNDGDQGSGAYAAEEGPGPRGDDTVPTRPQDLDALQDLLDPLFSLAVITPLTFLFMVLLRRYWERQANRYHYARTLRPMPVRGLRERVMSRMHRESSATVVRLKVIGEGPSTHSCLTAATRNLSTVNRLSAAGFSHPSLASIGRQLSLPPALDESKGMVRYVSKRTASAVSTGSHSRGKDLCGMLASGLNWELVQLGGREEGRKELKHPALATALKTKTEFTPGEWRSFRVKKLRMKHFVKIDEETCYQPVAVVHRKFRALPGFLVPPGAVILVANFFMTGVTEGATGVAMEGGDCGFACIWPAIIALALLAAYLVFGLAMILNFYYRLDSLWEPEDPPDDPDEVEDPLYRWISKVRKHVSNRFAWTRHVFGDYVVMTRDRGEFVRRQEDMMEPDRTERLLLNPFNMFPDRPSDAYDGLKINWLHRASGDQLGHIMFNYAAYLTQLLIAAFAGIGPYLTPRSLAARAQIVTTMGLQFGFALWAKFGGAASDRVDGNICACQFFMEGLQTALLLAADLHEPGNSAQLKLQEQAFLVALVALFLPIFEKGYDAFIVQISTCLRKKKGEKFSFSQAAFAMAAFLLQLPSLILSFMGISAELDSLGQVDEGLEAGETGVDDVFGSVDTDGVVDGLNDAYVDSTAAQIVDAAQEIGNASSDGAYLERIANRAREALPPTFAARDDAEATPAAAVESQSESCSIASTTQRPGFSWLERAVDEELEEPEDLII